MTPGQALDALACNHRVPNSGGMTQFPMQMAFTTMSCDAKANRCPPHHHHRHKQYLTGPVYDDCSHHQPVSQSYSPWPARPPARTYEHKVLCSVLVEAKGLVYGSVDDHHVRLGVGVGAAAAAAEAGAGLMRGWAGLGRGVGAAGQRRSARLGGAR